MAWRAAGFCPDPVEHGLIRPSEMHKTSRSQWLHPLIVYILAAASSARHTFSMSTESSMHKYSSL